MAAMGVQVHGGMGFIEETGAAQYVRDARIITIYEGTTGIQAIDLLGRKIGRDSGATMTALIADMHADAKASGQATLIEGVEQLRDATQSLLQAQAATPANALAVAVPYLELAGVVAGGWLMAKAGADRGTQVERRGPGFLRCEDADGALLPRAASARCACARARGQERRRQRQRKRSRADLTRLTCASREMPRARLRAMRADPRSACSEAPAVHLRTYRPSGSKRLACVTGLNIRK